MHRVSRPVGTIALAALVAAGAGMGVADSAAAAGCAASVTISGPNGSKLTLSPNSVKVQVGQCVSYTNSTSGAKVSLSISQGGSTVYSATIAKGATASFSPSAAGKGSVSASSSAVAGLLKASGSGSVTVTAAPSPHPSKSSSKPSPKNSKSPNGKKPNVAPKPKSGNKNQSKHNKNTNNPNAKGGHGQTPQPHATGIKLPPLPPLPSVGTTTLPKGSKPLVAAPGVSTPPSSGQPGTTSTSPVAAVISGPIEPLDNNSRGLPVAVGVLVVLGIATGWGRVLLAASGPGDKRTNGGHSL